MDDDYGEFGTENGGRRAKRYQKIKIPIQEFRDFFALEFPLLFVNKSCTFIHNFFAIQSIHSLVDFGREGILTCFCCAALITFYFNFPFE